MASAMMPGGTGERASQDFSGTDSTRSANILSAKAVSDAIRTSLGPRGMDKMIVEPGGDVVITNDGATILQKLEVGHPCARMMVEVSKAQDVEAGDGTSTVVVLAGAFLSACERLLSRGIHPCQISTALAKAELKAEEFLVEMSQAVDIDDRDTLIQAATTSLSSKAVAAHSQLLAPLAVDAVKQCFCMAPKSIVADGVAPGTLEAKAETVDLRDIRLVKAIGGTVEETDVVRGLVLKGHACKLANNQTSVQNARIGLIQFQLSSPKTDMESTVVISDYQQMDRVLKEDRQLIFKMCKKIKDTGCNVLFIQKSILRDATTVETLQFLAKMKILVVKDVERDDIDYIVKSTGCKPVSNLDLFTESCLGFAERVEPLITANDVKFVKVSGIPNPRTVTILVRGSNKLIVDEAERSLHDALCVVRSLVKKRYLIAGGGAPEVEMAVRLGQYARSGILEGLDAAVAKEYADAFEIVPFTLAENAGLNPIAIVTELRNKHQAGERNMGINVRKGCVTNMLTAEDAVIQPLQVTLSALKLATELTCTVMKIDDLIPIR